jgi:thioredoxin-related protein
MMLKNHMKKIRHVFATVVFGFSLHALCAAPVNFQPIKGQDLLSGQEVVIDPSAAKKKMVLTFLSSKCPCSNSHVAILRELAKKHPAFEFVAVHSNADEKVDQAKEYFAKAQLGFAVLQDTGSQLANRFRALKTPHTFVLNENGEMLYKGGVTSSNNGPAADHQYLADALNEIESGQPVKVAEGRTLGCVIAR